MIPYQSLKARQASHRFAHAVMDATRTFPREERFELTTQLRRAALSAPTNLVEGRFRFGSREFLRFVRIAAGSLGEADYLLLYARECGYVKGDDYDRLIALRREASYLVNRLARRLDAASGD